MFELPIQQYQRAAPQPDQRLPLASANAPSSHSSSRCTALPEAFDALPSFTKEIANDYSPRQAVLALARHVAIGGRDTRPTLPLLSFEWPAITDAQLLLLTSGRMYHAELIRENTTYQFFPASAVCCPGHLAHFGRKGWEVMSNVFALHLPDAEHEELLRNVPPGTQPIVPEAFGYLRYGTTANGTVQILEINNDLYESLLSDELRARYRDWQCELFDGFIEYVRSSADMTAQSTSAGAASFREHETRSIVIPSPAVLLENGDSADPSGIIGRYQEVPCRFGFTLQTLSDDSPEPDGEFPYLREGLVLTVDSPSELRVNSDTVRLDELLKLYARLETFPPHTAPLPRLSLPRERLNASALYPSFEVVPASPVALADALAPALVYELACHEHIFAQHRHLLDAVLEADFTLMSRGFVGGMNDDWAVLPDVSLSPGVHVFPVQSELQNRHPSLRIVSVDESGAQTAVMVGIKGAGIADRNEDSVVALPEGLRAPIYKTTGERVASHAWWGGLPLEEAVAEASRSIGLLGHVAQFHPKLTNRVPFPLRLAVPTMYPVWSEECTEWVPPYQYAELILGESGSSLIRGESDEVFSPTERANSADADQAAVARTRQKLDLPFATLITTTPSDVRVSTLVDRIFNGKKFLGLDARSRFEDITHVMRFLYSQHGFSLVEPLDPRPLPNEILSFSDVTEYLRHIAEQNRESSHLIYQRVCGDTLTIIKSVHQRGGHLGGGKIEIDGQTVGIGNGGAPAMRNVDICGGFHDLAAGCHFPWHPVPPLISERDSEPHLETMKKFDLIYWAETEQWMRLIVFGAPFNPRAITETFVFSPGHDLMLYSDSPSTPRIHRAAKLLQTGGSADEVLSLLCESRD